MKITSQLHSVLVAALFVILGTNANATSYAPPADRIVKSPNGRFDLVVVAKTGQHRIQDHEQPAKTLWSFQRPVWHHDYFVSSDGAHVAWVCWPFIQTEELGSPAIVVHSAKGVVSEWSFKKIGDARRYHKDEIGPIGDFWRVWREEVQQTGDVVSIVTPTKKRITIDLIKGVIAIH